MQEISLVAAFAISNQCSVPLTLNLYLLSIYILTVLCVCIEIYTCIYMYINTGVHTGVLCICAIHGYIHMHICSLHMCIYNMCIYSISGYYIRTHILIICVYTDMHTHINAAD